MSTRSNVVLPLVLERRAKRAPAKEIPAATPANDRMTRARTSSWDPYEVWKTRVKNRPGQA
jgi:hypothetical protein